MILNFCNYVLNFASRESAERWASERDGIVLLPVDDAFQVGLRAWSRLRVDSAPDGRSPDEIHRIDGDPAGR